MRKGLVIGVSGASGVVYTYALLNNIDLLRKYYERIYVVETRFARKIAEHEIGTTISTIAQRRGIDVFDEDDMDSILASSSNLINHNMIIVPCSLNTVAKLAHGIQDNLLLRTASSIIRMKGKLIIVFRETPLSLIDLENLAKLARIGAIILPASPAFYHKPVEIKDLIDFIVGKILDVLGIEHNIYRRWRGHLNSSIS